MDTQIKRHRQIKPFHLNTVFAKNVVTPINKLTLAQLNSYLSKQPSFNLIRNKPDYLKMHFLNTKITLKCLFFFSSQLFLQIFRWWCNNWCYQFSRESASSISCYRSGVFTCWQNMRLIQAHVWSCKYCIT